MKRLISLTPALYILFLMLPIYWLLNMSFKTTNEILGGFSLWPHNFTLENYRTIFNDPTWYMGYVNSMTYVSINTVISGTRSTRSPPPMAAITASTSNCCHGVRRLPSCWRRVARAVSIDAISRVSGSAPSRPTANLTTPSASGRTRWTATRNPAWASCS